MNRNLALATLTLLLTIPAGLIAREAPESPLPSYDPWPAETVTSFEHILIQDNGRVKPIYTVARFKLLQFSGRTSATFATQDGETHKLHYAEWLLDVLFRGEVAKDMPIFTVDDSETVVQIGVSPKAKRDKYSYNELLPGRSKLAELASQYAEKQQQFEASEKDPQYELTRIEGMVLNLGKNISAFEYLLGQFSFARPGDFVVNENILPTELVALSTKVDPVEMLDKMPEMTMNQLVQVIQQPPSGGEDEAMFTGALRLFFFYASSARGLSIFPPQDADTEEWLSAGDVMLAGLASKEERPWAIDQLKEIQKMVSTQKTGEQPFQTALDDFSAAQKKIADDRGEGKHSELEVQLYRGKWFTNALVFFIIAFVFTAFSWLSPGSKYGRFMILIASLLAVVGLVLDTYGISLRCIIRSRPPITNLYDTVLFITAVAVFLGLFIELVTRIGVGTLIAVVSGVAGMFLSIKYEAKEATDTMGQLVAVLDTNFWLWTHVTIINIGYAAGMVSALIGMLYLGTKFVIYLTGADRKVVWTTLVGLLLATTVYIFFVEPKWVPFGYAFGSVVALITAGVLISSFFLTRRAENSKEFSRVITRMNYGIICFCLFFSLVGTVLGGIWANYSWGRFWGWDPKENGALTICLWTLVILHGRFAGWIREIGIHMNAVVLGVLVTFSWWGVNNLGVGLHSYGFTEGVWQGLYTAWVAMSLFLVMGVVLWYTERRKKKKRAADEQAPGKPLPA